MRGLLFFCLLAGMSASLSHADVRACSASPELDLSYPTFYQFIEDNLTIADEINCAELEIGGSKVLNDSRPSSTFVGQAYELTRTGEKDYRIRVNPQFTRHKKSMRAFVQKCVSEMNEFLIGPAGEKLSIELADPADQTVPPVKIGVSIGPLHRTTSHYYRYWLGCPTVRHELFHLLGMVDEYHENEDDFGCRVEGPRDSLMSHQKDNDRIIHHSGPVVLVKACVCEKNTKERCAPATKPGQYTWPACPAGYEPRLGRVPLQNNISEKEKPAAALAAIDYPKFGCGSCLIHHVPAFVSELTEVPWAKSMLYPAQFRAVTRPGCQKLNRRFYRCAKTAYLPKDKNKRCPSVRDGCAPDFIL